MTTEQFNPGNNALLGQMLAEAATVMIWIADTEKSCIYFNQSWLSFRGRSLEQEFGFGWADGVHPEDFDRCLKIYTEAFDAREAFSMDYRLLNHAGEYRWIRDDGSPYINENGEFKGYIGSCFDITEIFEAKRKAEEREKRFQILADTISDVFWMSGVGDMEVMYVSPGFEKLWGIETEKLYENPNLFMDAVLPEDREELTRIYQQHHQHGKPYECNYRIRSKDGKILYIGEKGYPVKDDSGEVLYMAGTSTDLTMQQQLLQRLIQVEKMDALGQLASGLAHDYNNQLAGIMGYAELLIRLEKDQELVKYIKSIIATCQHAGEMTKKLLSYSRNEDLSTKTYDLHAAIRETLDMVKHSFDKLITIEHDLMAMQSLVSGDSAMMQNVILNLAINARDAMPKGGILKITTEQLNIEPGDEAGTVFDLKPGDYIVMKVSDTGIGMSESVKGRIFEPYFTTKGEHEGTGLGLASAYWSVKQHQGLLVVESELGKGSCFSVFLPLDIINEEFAERTFDSDDEQKNAGKHILIVDDESEPREVMAKVLSLEGHRVSCVDNGVAAVELYTEQWRNIDVVILDMLMPGLNGLDTFTKMKMVNPDIQTIVVSGFCDPTILSEIKQAGVKTVLQKPVRVQEVLDHIEPEDRG